MRLKKNGVSIDIINFANPDNVSRLEALVNTANSGHEDAATCHFLDFSEGSSNITDMMITSPILVSDMAMGGAAGGDPAAAGEAGAGGAAGLGFDPNMDPELAEAIRLSLM